MATPLKIETPFELIVGDAKGEIQNGDVPVRWCVTPKLVKQMEDDGIKDPHVLIITYNEHSFPSIMQKQLIPLSDLMTYARFTKAGECEIYAWIVDGLTGRKEIHERFIDTGHGKSVSVVSSFDNTPTKPSEVAELYAMTAVSVTIPKGVFGKEPPRWLKWFVNLWHEKKVVDECHYRQRTIFAFTLKWIPVLILTITFIIARIVGATLLTLTGFRTLPKWKYVIKPWSATFEMAVPLNVLDFSEQDFLFGRNVNVNGYIKNQTHLMMVAFTPIIPILIWGIAAEITGVFAIGAFYAAIWVTGIFTLLTLFDSIIAFTNWFRYTSLFSDIVNNIKIADLWIGVNGYGPTLIILLGTIIAVTIGWLLAKYAIFVSVMISFVVTYYLIDVLVKWILNRELEHNDYSEIRELLCPNDKRNLLPDYKLIPVKQRSIRLFYLNTKNKMCKPMQM